MIKVFIFLIFVQYIDEIVLIKMKLKSDYRFNQIIIIIKNIIAFSSLIYTNYFLSEFQITKINFMQTNMLNSRIMLI